MPKRVDHDERRQQIAEAVFRVTARGGLDAVSLRHVATEAGVTAGMVQHYFPSRDAMMAHALEAASERYEQRMIDAIDALGADPSPRDILRAILLNFIPRSASEISDGRIGLAFQAYASTREDLAQRLATGERLLRERLTQLVVDSGQTNVPEAAMRATALSATAEGLALMVLSSGLPAVEAIAALERQLDLNTST